MKNITDQKYQQKSVLRKRLSFLLGIIFLFSLILEWLGWRITTPDVMIWNIPFLPLISGALTTTTGALFPGGVIILIGFVFPRYRSRIKQKWLLILAVGAAFFLLIMFGLVLWAP